MSGGRLNIEDFTPHVGTAFTVPNVPPEQRPYAIELASAEPIPLAEGAPKTDPFRLIFEGPATPYLPQGVYDFEHDGLGVVGIFIVPLGSESPGGPMRYEAIFN